VQLDLTEDQALFHETTVRFIEAELPVAKTRAWHDDSVGYDPKWLQKAAELGWFSMLVPEADGGGSVSGAGFLDAAILAEEMGRNVQPGPFVPMNVVAATIARCGTAVQRAEVLPGVVAGTTVATWAWASPDGGWDDGAGVTATGDGDRLRLDGARGAVQDAASADLLLVAASRDGEPVHVLVPTAAGGVTITPLASLDLSRRFADVSFDGVTVGDGAVVGSGAEVFDVAHQTATALTAAETVGAADALFTLTLDYARDRIAFGRPIGSFQAIKHILADQVLSLEICKAAAVAAAAAVQEADPAATEVVAMAAASVGERANALAQQCLQVHGGIGYTWEHDLHLYLRRIQSNSVLYGEPALQRERVCAFHGLGVAS
jgi:alkylation response protein AidB-like acyl-CoA dehydrogenase